MNKITVTNNNIHIQDSYMVPKKSFDTYFEDVEILYSEYDVVKNRKRWTMKLEWATHNALYDLNIMRDHTKDVDLNWPQKWYATAAYIICGSLVWLFIK